jgi:SAM-dependent methyltransferase
MKDVSSLDPTGRFTGLADLYARHRPDYPPASLDYIVARCELGTDTVLVDVGCGTGISTRLLAARGIPVVGVEPNDEMRGRAEAEPAPPTGPAPRYVRGTAEATGLPEGMAAAVLSAQAFHWFDAPAALREFHRILRPGGQVALIWNERDESDAFSAAFGDVVRSAGGAAAIEARHGTTGAALLSSELFTAGERVPFHHVQELDEAGLLGRAFSTSHAPREPVAAATHAAALREAFNRWQRSGKVVLQYQTTVYLARRRDGLARLVALPT